MIEVQLSKGGEVVHVLVDGVPVPEFEVVQERVRVSSTCDYCEVPIVIDDDGELDEYSYWYEYEDGDFDQTQDCYCDGGGGHWHQPTDDRVEHVAPPFRRTVRERMADS